MNTLTYQAAIAATSTPSSTPSSARSPAAGLMMIPLSAPMLPVPFVGALFTRWISTAVLPGPGQLIAAAGLG
ncbi:hypothetical protein FKV24_010720 [Lysobacter maris]|uniref:Uncharacterized protein n=1 Tax=Marilutibacter maris TaxID=1605891 RepID=A0A508ASF5_9GAMM|nr:hypothetical protein [Lysobacter maris]KAB8185236.1 hypothetical protein FKV24_010720 [Lysobacter maris]